MKFETYAENLLITALTTYYKNNNYIFHRL